MALRDALRFVAGLHAFNEAIQELADDMEKCLFMQLANKWFAMISGDLDTESYDTEDNTEDELGENLEDEVELNT